MTSEKWELVVVEQVCNLSTQKLESDIFKANLNCIGKLTKNKKLSKIPG